MARRVDVRVLKHQSGAYSLIFQGDGRPKSITLAWGRGIGKSYFIRLVIWLLIASHYGKKRKTLDGVITGIRIYMLMPTLKQFKQVHGALLEAENETKWKFLGGKLNKTDYSLTFPDGSYFIPVPAALATSERGRGFRGDVVIFDEGDDIDPSVRISITQPWLSEPWSIALEIIAGTPKRGRHGMLYAGWMAGKSQHPDDADAYSFKTASSECPEVFSPRLLEKARREYPPAVYAREFDVDFDSAEGLVYPFEEDFHVREPGPEVKFRRYCLGIDHGWQDPGVFILFGITGHGEDSIMWALDEVYKSECPNAQWDAIARERFQGLDAYPDPSRPDRIHDLRRAGLRCKEVDNSIEAGVARVASLMFRRQDENGPDWCRLYVSPRCENLIRELKLYRRKRDPQNPNRFLEDIVDKDNHCLVAGTQVETVGGPKTIELIEAGELVWTRTGLKTVTWAGQTQVNAEIWTLETERGIIEGTADHPVWTQNRGWARLDELKYGDILVAWERTDHASEFTTTASPIDDTQKQRTATCAITSDRSTADICIAQSGNMNAGQSRLSTTFTISTAILSITESRILPVSMCANISMGTRAQETRNTEIDVRLGLSESGRLPQPGIAQKLDLSGTLNMGKNAGKRESQLNTSAGTAERYTSQSAAGKPCSAPTNADQPTGETAELTMFPGHAPFAGQSSASTDTPRSRLARVLVLGVYRAQRSAPVFDLTVEDAHEFFANGVLVHNSCDATRYAAMGEFGPLPAFGNYRAETPGR